MSNVCEGKSARQSLKAEMLLCGSVLSKIFLPENSHACHCLIVDEEEEEEVSRPKINKNL